MDEVPWDTALNWDADEYRSALVTMGRKRNVQRLKARTHCCCNKSAVRSTRTGVLAGLMAMSVGLAVLVTLVLENNSYSVVSQKTLVLQYPCNANPDNLYISVPGRGTLSPSSGHSKEQTNISSYLHGDLPPSDTVALFDFYHDADNFTRYAHIPDLKLAMALYPWLSSAHHKLTIVLSGGTLTGGALHVKVLAKDPCTASKVWARGMEASAFIVSLSTGLKAHAMRADDASRSVFVCETAAAVSRTSGGAPQCGRGLYVAPGACEQCTRHGSFYATAWPMEVTILFYALNVVCVLAFTTYVVVAMRQVFVHWYTLYVLKVCVEYHLVDVKMLPHDAAGNIKSHAGRDSDDDDDDDDEPHGGGVARPLAISNRSNGSNNHGNTSNKSSSSSSSANENGHKDADVEGANGDVLTTHTDFPFMLKLIAGSHGEVPRGDVNSKGGGGGKGVSDMLCSVRAWQTAFPCFACCCWCCPGHRGCCCCPHPPPDQHSEPSQKRRRRLAREFLEHFLHDVMGPLQALDFLVSDPIHCDTRCGDAFLSACLHAAVGVLPHIPLIYASKLMGCPRDAEFGLPEEAGGQCATSQGPHALQSVIMGLVAFQSITWTMHATSWYWNAPFVLRRMLRALGQWTWLLEGTLALAYVLNVVMWLLFAVVVDPLRAAVPITYVLSLVIYVHYASDVLHQVRYDGSEGAHAIARLMTANGIDGSAVLALLLWGLFLLVVLLVWISVGLSLKEKYTTGSNDWTSYVGSIFAGVTAFSAAVYTGKTQAKEVTRKFSGKGRAVLKTISDTTATADDGTKHTKKVKAQLTAADEPSPNLQSILDA